jgi:putative colanic acid biosynthesis UDP-glucose lipid carrier transferase
MARKKQGRFSRYIRPITYLIDLYIINFLAIKYVFNNEFLQPYWFFILISASWIIISIFSRFYNVYRYTPEIRILNLLLIQCLLFLMTIFSVSGIFPFLSISPKQILIFVLYSGVFIGAIKFVIYYFMLKFRADFGGNYRRTIIIGNGAESNSLEKFFQEKTSTGYRHIRTILPNKEEDIEKYFNFILEEKIDEIYCSLPSLSETQIKAIIDFAENNLKTVKFIPSFENLYSKKLKYETYDYVPVLSLRNILLQEPFNKFIKRLFDIVFSLFIIVCVLSWLIPVLAIIIKSESKGTIFFRQIRNGYNFKQFYCYKFRSMKINAESDTVQATRNDKRLTRVGTFLRKTSIDELPQFFNVLAGNMSVVGPRPHMVNENEKYLKSIDKFMVRHFIKPGITGLAQVNGYRGEIETHLDIVNRIKYDINYIENWSFLLDIKIIILTVFNSLRGEKKAY